MPTIQEDLVTALTGLAAGGVHPMVAPQNTAAPWICYTRLGGAPQHTFVDGEPIKHSRIQIDVFATTYSAAQALMTSVEAAIQAMSVKPLSVSRPQDLFEEEAMLYRVTQDFSFWHV